MKYHVLLFSASLTIVGYSCAKKHKVIEADLKGAWECVKVTPISYGQTPRKRLAFYNEGNQLVMRDYFSRQRVEINGQGDSLTLRQGCLGFKTRVSFQKAKSNENDTLTIVGYGSFTRMSNDVFVKDINTFIKHHEEGTALMNKSRKH